MPRRRKEQEEQRRQRMQALIDQATSIQATLTDTLHQCEHAVRQITAADSTPWLEAHIERLQAAQTSLKLATHVLQLDDPDAHPKVKGKAHPSARDLHTQLNEALGRWYRRGDGWWEARTIWRPHISITIHPTTKETILDVVWYPFGPYYYRH